MRLKRRIGSQQTNFEGKKTGLFKPEFIDRGVWLTPSVILFKMKSKKINIVVKVFQRNIMICILSAIKVSWMFFKRQE